MKTSARLEIVLGVLKDCKIIETENKSYRNKWDEEEHPECKNLSNGVWAKLPDSDLCLSIQTHPLITGGDDTLCETALIGGAEQTVVYIRELGYDDTLRHETADDLKSHLVTLVTQVKGRKLKDMTVSQEPNLYEGDEEDVE